MIRKLCIAATAMLAVAAGVAVTAQQANAASGFYISGGKLYDANNKAFVMRGVNHAFIWFQGRNSSFADIKRAGANTVRVVIDQGTSAATAKTAVTQCKNNKLVCVLEIHSTTGYSAGNGKITLSQAADVWVKIKSAVQGQEKYVIVNLGNEPYSSSTDTAWISQTKNAISKLRNAGISNTLMADAPGWGQDGSNLMRNNASSVFNSDPSRNVIFSVHMYGTYGSSSKVTSYLNYFADNKLPLVVGEFGHKHSGVTVAVDSILSTAQSRGIGWLAWSWCGNGGDDKILDMTNNWNANSLTTWGKRVVNGTNGLKATSKQASVY